VTIVDGDGETISFIKIIFTIGFAGYINAYQSSDSKHGVAQILKFRLHVHFNQFFSNNSYSPPNIYL